MTNDHNHDCKEVDQSRTDSSSISASDESPKMFSDSSSKPNILKQLRKFRDPGQNVQKVSVPF